MPQPTLSPHGRLLDPAGLIFGILLPVAIAIGGVLLTWALESQLPERIASHWTATDPDGYSRPMTFAWVLALVIVLVGAGCAAIAALAHALLLMRRMMLLVGLTVTGLIAVLWWTTLTRQIGAADPSAVELPWYAVPLGLLLGLAAGLLGAALLRDLRERIATGIPRTPRGLPPVHTSAGFGWLGTAGFAVVIFGCAAGVAVTLHSLWPLAAAAPVVAILVAVMHFDVRVDDSGLRVRNLGMTSLSIDVEEIESAEVTEIRPFRDFGGWGLRVRAPRDYGIVTHTGPAVVVRTASGLRVTITSDRAEAMAAILRP
mgnify:CR=1 FL=1